MIGGPPGTVQIGTTSADHPNGIVALAIGGCASGTVAVATVAPDLVGRCGASGAIGVGLGTDAYGTQAAVSPTGNADGNALSIGWQDSSRSWCQTVAISVNGTSCGLVSISVLGPAAGDYWGDSVQISGGGPAQGGWINVSGLGPANGNSPSNGISVSGTGPAAGAVAASGGGSATSENPYYGTAVSGVGPSRAHNLAVSGAGASRAHYLALSGTNDAYASSTGGIALGGGNTEGYLAGSGWGRSYGSLLGMSGWEEARGHIALSGQGYATGTLLGLSGTGPAGAQFVALSGLGSTGGNISISGAGSAWGTLLSFSGTGGSFSRDAAVSGGHRAEAWDGVAVAPRGDTIGGKAAVGMGNAWGGLLAVSAAGGATSPGGVGVGWGHTSGSVAAVSATGDADSNTLSVAPLGRAS